jgi:hypothetical protein
MPHTYILYSEKLNKYNIGVCIDMDRRIYEHNIGHSKFTISFVLNMFSIRLNYCKICILGIIYSSVMQITFELKKTALNRIAFFGICFIEFRLLIRSLFISDYHITISCIIKYYTSICI